MVDIILWVILPLLTFGIMMFFFAWAGSVIARRRIARLLQQDEIVLRKAEAFGGRSPPRISFGFLLAILPREGTLYLTNRRLICRRYLLAIRGPAVFEMPLGSIDECLVRRVGWLLYLEIRAGDEHLILYLYRHRWSFTRLHNRGLVEDMVKAINEARGGTTPPLTSQGMAAGMP